MRRLRFWVLIPAFCLLALPLWAASQNELKLGAGSPKKFGSISEIPLSLTTTDQVEGLQVAFDWNGANGEGDDLVLAPSIASADTVAVRIEASYMVLGVVMDSNGVGGQVINPGTDILLATARIKCKSVEASTPVAFHDLAYATVDGGPLLENIVVVGGLSIGSLEGLVLTNGSFDCVATIDRFYIDSANATSATGAAKVLMENRRPVEGYVVALCHNPADLTLPAGGIEVGAAALAQAADFIAAEVFPNGGTLGVVIDLVAPYTNNTIPVAEANHIATYKYRCNAVPPSGAGVQYPLTFCDNVLGDPLKDNVMVVGGLSLSPALENGTFTCLPGCVSTGPEGPPGSAICRDGLDNDCNGLTDAQDPGCQLPAVQSFLCGTRGIDPATKLPDTRIQQSLGLSTEVCFYILNPLPSDVDPNPQYDHIQGFSMALSFCCNIVADNSFDITGTILEAIGAEYVTAQADNDLADGDGCELIIGVLVDALPPFDGATIPPTDRVQLMGCVKFTVKDDAPCGQCCPIEFTNGINGTGKIPINNLISVDNFSRRPAEMVRCELCVVDKERFFRGDCNFSGGSGADGSLAVDIADAAAVVSYLFLPGTYKFQPLCLDACDCNDDGRIDLADAVCILRYLFQGGRFPPLPGPGYEETGLPNPNQVRPTEAGPDPTPDMLDCAAGARC